MTDYSWYCESDLGFDQGMCGSMDLFLCVLVANDVIMHIHEAHLLCHSTSEQVGAMLVVDDCEFDPVLALGFRVCQLDHALSHWLRSCGICILRTWPVGLICLAY